ncbi:MAG: STAS/SEC14 domain-containing protein [bacterium]
MLQFIPVQDENIFSVRATGKLGHGDYASFLPELERQIKRYGKISLFMELDDFFGWDLSAISDEMRWELEHGDNLEKVAIVGDKAWQRWMTLMAKPFTSAEVRYFPRDEAQEAWEWLREREPSEQELAELEIAAYAQILVPVDFSPHSVHAAKRAVIMAEKFNAHLLMLNVINEEYLYDILYEPGDLGFGGYRLPPSPFEKDALRDSAHNRMRMLLESLGVKEISTEVVMGTPSSAITSFAAAQKVDLIVMGTHGRRGVARLLGSTAHAVQGRAHCEVLTVPLKGNH